MTGKKFLGTASAVVTAALSMSSFASGETFTGGTITAPAGGIRWGQDSLTYTASGTCTGGVADFRKYTFYTGGLYPYVPGVALEDATHLQGVGGGQYPQTTNCTGGTYQVSVTLRPTWFTTGTANQPAGMLPGTYSLYAQTYWPADGPFPATTLLTTPTISTTVRFDHPFYLRELDTGLTPIGGSARASYVDPAFAPIPLPTGMPSPQLIEVSNTNQVGMTLPFTVADGMLWIYDQLPSMTPQWRSVRSTDLVTYLSGTTAILPLFSNPSYIAFSYTRQVTPVTPQADLWWGGADESGWGLSIGRNGDALFVAGFLYDYGGKPMWAVMQNGTWDSSHTVWKADVYIPSSAPFDHYDASKLDMGSSNGKAVLQFTGPTTATFQYLGGYTHAIQRFQFASSDNGPYHGYWFGGASQSGWGLHLAQQGDSVFATWYTYGADGRPTWFFMPGATKLSATHFSGALYRTTGGSWPTLEHYDPNATKVTAAGTLDLSFTSDNAGTLTAVVDGKTIVNPIQRFGF